MKLISIPKKNTDFHSLEYSKEKNLIPNRSTKKIALPTMEGIQFEFIDKIISLEAKGNYTFIHFLDQRKILVCKTLRNMELMLNNKAQFIRIHRSHTINLDHLLKYVRGKGGYVQMEGGTNINVSVGKKQDFLNALNYYFNC